MNTVPLGRCSRRDAFTLVEMMVSTALIIAIMTILLATVSNTQQLWKRTTAKAGQFQAARTAFESMTRRLGQATLNTYWRAYDVETKSEKAEYQFRRHSELQFLSGPTADIFSSPMINGLSGGSMALTFPTHGVFFFAPVGHTEYDGGAPRLKYTALDSLLSACGYFVEYGDDPTIPDFIREMSNSTGAGVRNRFRLMEMTVPAERVSIFQRYNDKKNSTDPMVLSATKGHYIGFVDPIGGRSTSWTRPFWMEEALRTEANAGVTTFRYARPLAENIIALVILPKQAPKDRTTPDQIGSLAPQYSYDSWRILTEDKGEIREANAARDNLLPPIVQVTMVAIDEDSALRLPEQEGGLPPDWTSTVFTAVKRESDFQEDIDRLDAILKQVPTKVNYRVFTTDVVLRGSKWSQDPKLN